MTDELISFPKKWCVRGNGERGTLLRRDGVLFRQIESISPIPRDIGFLLTYYYVLEPERCSCYPLIPDNYTLITLDDLEKYIIQRSKKISTNYKQGVEDKETYQIY